MKYAAWSSSICSRPMIVFVAGLACAAAPAAAHEPINVDEVLTNVRRAVGYEAFTKHTSPIQLKGTGVLAGNPVTYSLMIDAQGRFLQTMDGPISITTAYDGTNVWTRDLGGEVRLQELGDRQQTLLGAAILTCRWLANDSPLRFTPDETASTDAKVVLKFEHTAGIEHGTLEIDRATWRPATWTYAGPAATNTITLDGTVEFAGITFPAKIERTSTNGMEVSTTVQSVADAPVFIRSPFEFPSARADDARFDPSQPAAVEIKKAPTGHLLVHPLVDGKDVGWFIFDTGAGANVLALRAMGELKLDPVGHIPAVGIGGAVMAILARPTTLTLGPMTIDKPMTVAMDLSFLDQYMGTPIGGIIGYGLLARAVVDIDMITPALALHDPATYNAPGLKWQRLILNDRVPCIEATFEDHTAIFRLDTGAAPDTVTFHAPAVEQFKLLDNRETTPTMLGGVGGQVQAKSGQLAWFEIAGHRTQNVKVSLATEPKGAFADPYTAGNLGGGLIKPFTFVMDYQKNRIAFVPRDAAAK